MGRAKKLGLPNYLPLMKSTPTLPPVRTLEVQTCSAMERRAAGGTENQGNGLKQQNWLEGKNKGQNKEKTKGKSHRCSVGFHFNNEKKGNYNFCVLIFRAHKQVFMSI